MSVYKGYIQIGNPVDGWMGVRNQMDPDGLVALAAALRTSRDKARTGITRAFEAREQTASTEARMAAALTAARRRGMRA